MGYGAIPVERGCGSRQQGGVYFETGLGDDGLPIEAFIFDTPKLIPAGVSIPKRGVTLEKSPSGVYHIIDWIGQEHYPNVADWLEEARHFGISRRLPKNLDFGKLTAQSRLFAVHARAYIVNWSDYTPAPAAWSCPRHVRSHPNHAQWEEHIPALDKEDGSDLPDMCAGLWWLDVDGGEKYDGEGNLVLRSMPDGKEKKTFSYKACHAPTDENGETIRRVYTPAFVGSFPLTRLVVVNGGDSDETFSKISASAVVPVDQVNE